MRGMIEGVDPEVNMRAACMFRILERKPPAVDLAGSWVGSNAERRLAPEPRFQMKGPPD